MYVLDYSGVLQFGKIGSLLPLMFSATNGASGNGGIFAPTLSQDT